MATKFVAIRRRWRKWRHLTGAQRRVFRQAFISLLWVRPALRLRGLKRLCRVSPAGSEQRPPAIGLDADAIAMLVDRAAAVNPFNSTCLHRSLVLSRLLRTRGIANDLRIGVRRDETGGVAAHAWVEVNGVPLNDRPEVHQRFAAFESGFSSPLRETNPSNRNARA
jgi:hypothetical protein